MGLRCVRCGRGYDAAAVDYACPACSGNLDVVYDYRLLRKSVARKTLEQSREAGIWRYEALLPLKRPCRKPTVLVGNTPLYRAQRLGRELGLRELFIKDDGRNPSASFKDRAGAIIIAKALERREHVIAGASTGNAASSLACLCASLGLRPIIFVPETAPPAKIAQLLVFGAKVLAVRGTYDQAFDLCAQACARYGWYNRNTGLNPYTREGKKTCAYEIVEQLGWRCPDQVFVSVGDGNILSGLWKGFKDLHALGLIDRLPRMAAVQAAGSASILRAFESGSAPKPVSAKTLADSISVSLPRDGDAAVSALRESKGCAIPVSDQEILSALRETARSESVFAEPAGAAAVAGLRKAAQEGRIRAKELCVAIVTGNGLKDIASARQAAQAEPLRLEPTLTGLRRLLPRLGL